MLHIGRIFDLDGNKDEAINEENYEKLNCAQFQIKFPQNCALSMRIEEHLMLNSNLSSKGISYLSIILSSLEKVLQAAEIIGHNSVAT